MFFGRIDRQTRAYQTNRVMLRDGIRGLGGI